MHKTRPDPITPKNTVERIHPEHFRTREKYLLYLRHVFAYEYAVARAKPTDAALEIGCGDGYGTARLAAAVASIDAVDVDRETVEYAARKHGSSTCRIRHYDGDRLPFEDQTFDLVVAMQVIEHVDDDRQFLIEAWRVLKPGGLLLLTTPNRTHRVPDGQEPWNPFHVREYSPDELSSLQRGVFPGARVLGIHGSTEARRIEVARVRRGWSLRRLLPESLKLWIDGDVTRRYDLDDFFVAEHDVASSLDLLGECIRT